MTYLQTINLIFIILFSLTSLIVLHYLVFALIGLFTYKKFDKTDEKLYYAVMIGARNEQAVIGKLLDSINNCDYPKDKLKVFVVAHNCTDDTAKIAREHGAVVYEYDNPDECTLGYAYRYLVDKINTDYADEKFDGIYSINADNVMTKNYFDVMNDAFVARGKKDVITSYRNSENYPDNYMTCLYGIFFIIACRFEMRGRTVLDCTTRVTGTGYVFPAELIKNGWRYVTLTEDWEFSADQVAAGRKIIYCDEAEFFDEQPTTVPVMFRQRLRWARGHTIVFFTRFTKLVKSIFKKGKDVKASNRFSSYDLAVSIMPLGAIGIGLTLAYAICLALSPLFGTSLSTLALYGKWYAIISGISYAITSLSGFLIAVLERKRLKKANPFLVVFAIIIWPIFLFFTAWLDVVSLFTKNLKWKTIPHFGAKKREEASSVAEGDSVADIG